MIINFSRTIEWCACDLLAPFNISIDWNAVNLILLYMHVGELNKQINKY